MEKRNYKKIAKSVIDLEIKALKKLKNSINDSFNKAVESLANCQSKVILCGVGKSGLIAAKISATLSSVGTPSFSLSANDCSHGDLGSISKKDILILISYSGSTEELKNILETSGYDVFMVYVYSSLEKSLRKNEDRFERSEGEDRSLMPFIVMQTWANVTKNFIPYLNLFGANFVATTKDKNLVDANSLDDIIEKYVEPYTPKNTKPKISESCSQTGSGVTAGERLRVWRKRATRKFGVLSLKLHMEKCPQRQ